MEPSILITGASSGIGKALALEMAKRGYSLALTARRLDTLEKIKEEALQVNPSIQVEVRFLDVTDYNSVYTIVNDVAEKLKGLDIVFANAGIALGEKVGRNQFDKTRKTIEVNVLGAMATVDAAVSYFLKRGSGHIVGTSSVAAFRGFPRGASYSASKAAFSTYLEALRAEVYREKIDITVLYPGYIDTALNDMLPNRPFVINTEKGAAIMADLIEKRVKSSTVPAYPWAILGQLLKILPTRIIAKF